MNTLSPAEYGLVVLTLGAVTFATRATPFLLFGNRSTPSVVLYLGRMLPCAVIGLLVVYCLKGMTPLSYPFGLPELLGVLCVALLHIWKGNTLLSIGVGTVCYMLLVQFVFV